MKKKKNRHTKLMRFCIYTLLFISLSCIEKVPIKDEVEFESILIIEATITDEFKFQEILLSKTFKLEAEGPLPEQEAIVKLKDAAGNTIDFTEQEPGLYVSTIEFSASPTIDYYLEITTSDGRSYASKKEQLAPEATISDVRIERGFNENNDEGVSIFVDALDTTGEAKYYRYEYEETYKIIAPQYSPLELEILNNDFSYPQQLVFDNPSVQLLLDFFFELKLREEQEQVCYNTVASNTVLITSTEDLIETDTDSFRVRFLNRDSPEIIHRYSILVKQYGQSSNAFTFYKTLSEFSNSENVFSQVQAGFFEGNVFSQSDENEKVIGYFEVAPYDVQRVYFNYDDLFPGEQKPPYFISCDDTFFPIFLEEDFAHNVISSPVIDALTANFEQVYFDTTNDTSPSPFVNRPFELVLRPCGDCTVYGNNVAPDFWVE